MYLHPSHQLNTSLWRWSHNFQLSSYNQFTAQQEKVARKQSPALSRICGHEMQIAAAVMFKLRSFEQACKCCSCSSLLHYRWIPCYVFGDTLVVNIMGVTAVTSLLLRWWWWWLLSGVSATWGAIPRALSYAGVLRLWKLYFNMKHSWWEVGFMLRFELVWGYWNVLEFLMLMKTEISITILIGFFNLEVNQYCD